MAGRRWVAALGLLGLSVAIGVMAGWLDLRRSLDLLTGANVSTATESALVVVLCWLALGGLIVAVVVRSLGGTTRQPTKRSRGVSIAVLAVGLALLGAGLARQHSSYHVCCATTVTANEANRLVH